MAARNETTAVIRAFGGIDQSLDENLIGLESAWQAENMDTETGNLTVANGYRRHIPEPVPGGKRITRLMRYRHGGDLEFIVAAENDLYAYKNGAWILIKTYGAVTDHEWSYVEANLNGKNVLIIANGESPPVKYDGNAVTELGVGLPNVKYLALYNDRLIAAGDGAEPNRLYYSKSYDLGDWGLGETAGGGGGHIDIDPTAGDWITGIHTAFNTVLILKRGVLWYLSGVTPPDYQVRRIFGEMEPAVNTAVVCHAETAYMASPLGLETFNGVSIQPHKSFRCTREIFAGCSAAHAKAAEYASKLYFTLRKENGAYDDCILIYDLVRGTYMLRTGFTAADIVPADSGIYLIGARRYVCRWGEGRDYDGEPVRAFWETPETDFGAKNVMKTSVTLYTRAEGEPGSQLVLRHTFTDPRPREKVTKRLTPLTPRIIHPLMRNYGRRVKLRIENEGGRWFSLGGAQIQYELEED